MDRVIKVDSYYPIVYSYSLGCTKKAFILGCVPALTLLFCRKATTSHSAECIRSDKGIQTIKHFVFF